MLLFLKKLVRMLTRLRTITRDSHLCCANTSEDQSKRHYSKYTTIGRVLRLDHTTITETATSRRRAASPAPAAIAVVVSKEPESVDEDWSVPPVAAAVDEDVHKIVAVEEAPAAAAPVKEEEDVAVQLIFKSTEIAPEREGPLFRSEIPESTTSVAAVALEVETEEPVAVTDKTTETVAAEPVLIAATADDEPVMVVSTEETLVVAAVEIVTEAEVSVVKEEEVVAAAPPAAEEASAITTTAAPAAAVNDEPVEKYKKPAPYYRPLPPYRPRQQPSYGAYPPPPPPSYGYRSASAPQRPPYYSQTYKKPRYLN